MAEITIRISDKALKVVAAFVVVIFLLWGFSHFWSTGLFRPKCEIRMFVPEAQGVRVGASVRLDGMPIGTVSRVDLARDLANSNRRIEIALRIEKRFQNMIRHDSKASLVTEGLLGERYVSIQREFTGPPINPGGEIGTIPTKEVSVRDFIDAIGKKAGRQNVENDSSGSKSPSSSRKPVNP